MTPLLVGLGNPGSSYALTRHNAGFLFLDRWAEACQNREGGWSGRISASSWKEKYHGLVAEMSDMTAGDATFSRAVLFKPQAFMNRSGAPVKAVAAHYGIPASDWLVLHDEIDLPFLDIRLKHGGGHRGHNGLRDIMAVCGTGDFSRLRIGVGRPDDDDVADYVLSPFAKDEQARFGEVATVVNRLAAEWLGKKKRI